MKYVILEKKEVYVKVCLWIFLLVRKQYLPKKNLALLAQKFGKEKNCQNPFQAILRLKKTTFFMCVFPLYSEKKSETKNLVVFFYKSKNY